MTTPDLIMAARAVLSCFNGKNNSLYLMKSGDEMARDFDNLRTALAALPANAVIVSEEKLYRMENAINVFRAAWRDQKTESMIRAAEYADRIIKKYCAAITTKDTV